MFYLSLIEESFRKLFSIDFNCCSFATISYPIVELLFLKIVLSIPDWDAGKMAVYPKQPPPLIEFPVKVSRSLST